MNARRVASITRQIGSLFIELADALEEQAPKRERRVALPKPKNQPSPDAVENMRTKMRRAGVVAA
jgi:hypothetical protein